MKKIIRSYLPDTESLRRNRWLAPFADTLGHPRLWRLNRHSCAGGVAVGLFAGLIPGPLQMLGAALLSVLFRVNLPLSMLVTFYSNPLTIVPLYAVAWGYGRLVMPLFGMDMPAGASFRPPAIPDDADFSGWMQALVDWFFALGEPLLIGLPLLALTLAGLGYFAVLGIWRWHLVRNWHRRAERRKTSGC
jgi:uncharacterized protein (DUF2062 family)